MERLHFDLDQIRKNWDRDSTPPTAPAEKIAPTASRDGGSAPSKVSAEKFCPECGAEVPREGSSPEKVKADKPAPAASRDGGFAVPRVSGSPRAMLPSRFARIEAPRDPYPEAQALLVRVRALAHLKLAAHEPILAHFFDETAGIIQRLAAKPGEGESPPVDKKKLRTDLDRALGDLEDMVALWSGVGR